MQVLRPSVFCPIALFVTLTAAAQSPELRVINKAAEALGGKDKIMAVKTIMIEGRGTNPNIGQNPFPEGPLPTWAVPEYRRTFDLQNNRMQLNQRRVAMFLFALATDVRQIQGLDGDVAFNVNEGRAQRLGDAAVADRRIEMLGTPITIIRGALSAGARLSGYRRRDKEESIEVVTDKGVKATLTVDSVLHLPKSVSWISSSENLGDVVNTLSFLDYDAANGLQMPKRYLTMIDFRGWISADIQVNRTVIDGDVGDLAAPATVRTAAAPAPPQVNVTAQEVGKGIWWLAGNGNAFSVLFEFADHLALFETPTSEARSKAVIDKARTVVPGKPLTEVIVSHHHFDHTGGLRTAVAEGLTIISQAANEKIFREVTSRKATLKADLLTKSGKSLKFRAIDDALVLKDNNMEVVLYKLLDNTHAPMLIMAYVPRDKLLIQGDLIDVGWMRNPWAENYQKNLDFRGIQFTKDIPVHGKIATHAEELAALAAMEKNK